MSKLTVRQLNSLTDKDTGRKLFDGDGLYGRIRIQKTGITVTFEYRYKQQGKTRSVICGKWPAESLSHIRKQRDAKKVLLNDGIDPIEQNKTKKLQKKIAMAETIRQQENALVEMTNRRTFSDAIMQWAELELIRRKDCGKETLRTIKKDAFPVLGKLALTDITRPMLMDIFDQVVARGARVMANHLFADLRQFYNFAVAREWVESHPLAGLSKDKIGGRQKERERYLSEDEIIELKQCLPKSGLRQAIQLAIWIMLSTCCRVGELSRARWEHIDFIKETWIIPAQNSKNAKNHTIFLSDFAKTHFQELYNVTGHTQWCLPARDSNKHICPKSIAKQIKDRIREEPLVNRAKPTGILLLSGGTWTPHDLRRTGATMMGELGIIGEVIERCLNHVEQNKLKRIYQRHELKSEKYDAWEKLGMKLATLVNSGNNNASIIRCASGKIHGMIN